MARLLFSFVLFYLFVPEYCLYAQSKEEIDAYNLHSAIQSKNVDEVKAQIKNGLNVNTQFNGRNALQVACESGSNELVKIILDSGGDANSKRDNGDGITTLQNAIRSFKCTSEIIQMLLANGADVNAVGPDGNLAINDAIRKSGDKTESIKILSLLIDYKADINPKGAKEAPVITSVIHNRSDMLNLLLENGADPNVVDKNSKYPLHYAVENKDIDAVKLLLSKGAKTDVTDNERNTPLNYASKKIKKKYLDANSKKKYQEIVKILSK